MRKLIVFVYLVFIASSCQSVYIPKRNKIYYLKQTNSEVFKVHSTSPQKGSFEPLESPEISKIKDKGEFLILDSKSLPNISDALNQDENIEGTIHNTGMHENLIDKFYFPEPNDTSNSKIKNRFRYYDLKPVLQAMSIPIKIRPKRKLLEYADSFGTTTETGFNANLSLGFKLTKNTFRSNKNFLGYNTSKASVSCGTFVGIGAADLSTALTRSPQLKIGRKAPLVGYSTEHDQVNMGMLDTLFRLKLTT